MAQQRCPAKVRLPDTWRGNAVALGGDRIPTPFPNRTRGHTGFCLAVHIGMRAVGLILEEDREAIVAAWREAAHCGGPPVLEFAAPVFVRELGRALRAGLEPRRAWERCALLVRRGAQVDPAVVVREMGVLRRALWTVLRERRRAIEPGDRIELDGLLDETMAALVALLTRPAAARPPRLPAHRVVNPR